MRAALSRGGRFRLACLTLVLAALWLLGAPPLSREEQRLYDRVAAAQGFLWRELGRRGLPMEEETDPEHSGFIGLEWSVTSTTLGSLEAKRCSTNPLWAVQMLRWFDALGLQRGDRVAVLASSSFPGMLYSVLAAAEARGIEAALCVSLGSSNWGANRPEAPWPVLSKILIDGGFLRTRPLLYTLGGNGERGGGMPAEALELLTAAARADGLEPLRCAALEEVVEAKMSLVRAPGVRLLVNVGGSEGSLGESPDVLALPPGLLMPREDGGDGALGRALREGYPAVHLLNLRGLADACGVPMEGRRPSFVRRGGIPGAVGLLLFVLVMATHRRWIWEDGDGQ